MHACKTHKVPQTTEGTTLEKPSMLYEWDLVESIVMKCGYLETTSYHNNSVNFLVNELTNQLSMTFLVCNTSNLIQEIIIHFCKLLYSHSLAVCFTINAAC